MRSRLFRTALLLFVLGAAAYEGFTVHRDQVRVTDDGTPPPPPPSWP